ncbi:hypothetical protein OTU49_004232 [Cherax quadricarinatus]|uniref:Uncharacterized protein n=1 Tax=Cherax quadricarinatus TaxID=27406 RepID=A0AAW0WZL5_CHEQU
MFSKFCIVSKPTYFHTCFSPSPNTAIIMLVTPLFPVAIMLMSSRALHHPKHHPSIPLLFAPSPLSCPLFLSSLSYTIFSPSSFLPTSLKFHDPVNHPHSIFNNPLPSFILSPSIRCTFRSFLLSSSPSLPLCSFFFLCLPSFLLR